MRAARFRLVGNQHDRLAGTAHHFGKGAVGRRQAVLGIDDEQNNVGFLNGSLGLGAHPRFQAVIGSFFKTRRIDNLKLQIVELGIVDAPVARDARQVIDQRQLAADEAIEQRGLADIGTPDDGDCKTHGRR